MQLQSFLGLWRIERAIEDARNGARGRFTGSAHFTPHRDGLLYREEGRLRLGEGPEMAAARAYLWRDGGAGTIAIHFEDGRHFHRLHAGEDTPADSHDCPPDRYHVRYDFTRWPLWQSEWRVAGPRKDYRLLSLYGPD